MASAFSVTAEKDAFALYAGDKPLLTPEKKKLLLPTRALAEAIAEEWKAQAKFSAARMPLTALAYTAIDRVEGSETDVIEMLLAYVDTDTLCYRASQSPLLLERQKKEWDPVLAWVEKKLGATWATTTGVMPLDQSPQLHRAIGDYMKKQGAMRLAGCLLASSGFSSLALAIALAEKHLDAVQAFQLSRLEEETQAQQWGRDEEADARAARLQAEIVGAERFLRLLDAA